MLKLKKKVLNMLNNNSILDNELNDLTIYQKNLIKNYSNPVFDDKSKDILLNSYNDIDKLGKSLYRYNMLAQNNLENEAQMEKDNISNIVLKGYVSNNRYVWHSENGEHTCELCSSLDGKKFDYYDEVPERPHPNCRCYVEIISEDDNKHSPQQGSGEEPCDCVSQLDDLITQIDDAVQSAESFSATIEDDIVDIENNCVKTQVLIAQVEESIVTLSDEYGKHLPDCENNIDLKFEQICGQRSELQNLSSQLLGLLSPMTAFLNTVRVFVANYVSLLYEAYVLKQWGMDKFRHAKANCEATQQMGILGEMYATNLSDFKELYDQYTYVHSHKVTIEEAIADSERDQAANRFGREMGRKYPNCDCSILLHDLLPDYKK